MLNHTCSDFDMFAVLLCGLLSFIFLLAAAIDPAWVHLKQDTTFTGGSGEQETGQLVLKLGLTRALLSEPTFDSATLIEFTLTAVYPPNVLMQLINGGNEFRDGPQAVRATAPHVCACVWHQLFLTPPHPLRSPAATRPPQHSCPLRWCLWPSP